MELYGSLARVYVDAPLKQGGAAPLTEAQAHYFRNVLRKNLGDRIRVFNGRDGEWAADIQDMRKKGGAAILTKKIREQPGLGIETHLLFAPIKKDRIFFMIEKAVELGVTHLHPVRTARTDARQYNPEKTAAHIIEAAEQCERMDIPALYPLSLLKEKIAAWNYETPVLWCHERGGAAAAPSMKIKNCAFLIGPEGGFDENEAAFLSAQKSVKPLSLGDSILRAETAALFCLSWAKAAGLTPAG